MLPLALWWYFLGICECVRTAAACVCMDWILLILFSVFAACYASFQCAFKAYQFWKRVSVCLCIAVRVQMVNCVREFAVYNKCLFRQCHCMSSQRINYVEILYYQRFGCEKFIGKPQTFHLLSSHFSQKEKYDRVFESIHQRWSD